LISEKIFKIRKLGRMITIALLILSLVWSITAGGMISNETGKVWLGVAVGMSLFFILALLSFILVAVRYNSII